MHLLQVLLGFSPLPEEERAGLPGCPYADQQAVQRLWKSARACSGAALAEAPPGDLGAQVRRKLGRFLRCAALFYHFYTDVPLPPSMAPAGTGAGAGAGAAEAEAPLPSHEQLCRYLGLPESLRDFLLVLGVQDILDRWGEIEGCHSSN